MSLKRLSTSIYSSPNLHVLLADMLYLFQPVIQSYQIEWLPELDASAKEEGQGK